MQNKQVIPVYYCKNTISMAFYRCCSGIVAVVWCAVLNYTEREYDRRKKVITICLAVGILLLSVGHFVIDLNQRAERIQVRSIEEMDTFVASGEEYLPVDTILDKLKAQELYKDDCVEISDVVYQGHQ